MSPLATKASVSRPTSAASSRRVINTPTHAVLTKAVERPSVVQASPVETLVPMGPLLIVAVKAPVTRPCPQPSSERAGKNLRRIGREVRAIEARQVARILMVRKVPARPAEPIKRLRPWVELLLCLQH